MERTKDVIVLGSGLSILNLTDKDIEYINSCEVIIAVNKFMAFYKQTGIYPTHVYYVDSYELSVQKFLQYIFDVCRKDELNGLTFILDKKIKPKLTYNEILYRIKNSILNPQNIYRIIKYGKTKAKMNAFLIPQNCYYEFIEHELSTIGGSWANDLKDKLFHFRGSLSTVLNYISIKFPNYHIRLVGVDFNSPEYFFQAELENLGFQWQDYTSKITTEKGIHISAIRAKKDSRGNWEVSDQGTTIFDQFPLIIKKLQETGNKITSCNSESLLVHKNFVKFSPLYPEKQNSRNNID